MSSAGRSFGGAGARTKPYFRRAPKIEAVLLSERPSLESLEPCDREFCASRMCRRPGRRSCASTAVHRGIGSKSETPKSAQAIPDSSAGLLD